MLITLLKAKIHGAKVTETNKEYSGSLTIDVELMEKVGIKNYEQIHVWNINNGTRLITYAIPGEKGKRDIIVNGAGAHLNNAGDRIIIASFTTMDEKDADSFKPSIMIIDEE